MRAADSSTGSDALACLALTRLTPPAPPHPAPFCCPCFLSGDKPGYPKHMYRTNGVLDGFDGCVEKGDVGDSYISSNLDTAPGARGSVRSIAALSVVCMPHGLRGFSRHARQGAWRIERAWRGRSYILLP